MGFRSPWEPVRGPSCAGRSPSPSWGGLLLSQFLTLDTTPVIYIYLSRIGNLWRPGIRPAAPEADVSGLHAAE